MFVDSIVVLDGDSGCVEKIYSKIERLKLLMELFLIQMFLS